MAFRILKNKAGQSQAVEYAVVFFLVAAMIAAMSAYTKRAVQSRIRGARNYMWVQVNGTYNQYHPQKALPVEYEPYYVKTNTFKDEDVLQTQEGMPLPLGEGTFISGIDSTITSIGNADVASPRHAD